MNALTLDAGVAELLGEHGPFAQLLEGFAPRQQQQEMGARVAEVLEARETLVCEAGTGTGKTLAYLVPALRSGRRVIVSTGTRHLQDQLYHRDLPLVQKALGLPVRTALLKGRANYLCRYRLAQEESSGQFMNREQRAQLASVRAWAGRTRSGDIAELTGIPERTAIWPLVTSTTDNCLGAECPEIAACHLVRARKQAQDVDLLVVNHHLLLADLALKDQGFGELLPGADAYIIDEAHQFPDVASLFFGDALTSRQLHGLAHDTIAAQLEEAPDVSLLRTLADRLVKGVSDLRMSLGQSGTRAPWRELERNPAALTALAALRAALDGLRDDLEPLAERGRALESCWRRCTEFSLLLVRLVDAEDAAAEAEDAEAGRAGPQQVRWFQVSGRGFALRSTPLDIAEPLREQIARHPGAWIFTSATLAVGDSFEHFTRRLGIEADHEQRWESPFDFARQALLCVPSGMPAPSDRGYLDALLERATVLIEASGGRCFLLFTSHRALAYAERALDGRIHYPLLVQGSAPRADLLDRFRELGNAVLLGTGSFWEGVDVRGDALSCVIIDKLPFAAPDDPVLQARLDASRRAGGNPFFDIQVPAAVISLKQGAGRLIRDITDHGLLMIGDPRLFDRGYGRQFLASLPPMPVTRELDDAVAFLAGMPSSGLAAATED